MTLSVNVGITDVLIVGCCVIYQDGVVMFSERISRWLKYIDHKVDVEAG